MPPVFDDIVNALVKRRDGRRLDQNGVRLSRRLAAGGTLDDAAKEQLRQFQAQLAAVRHRPATTAE